MKNKKALLILMIYCACCMALTPALASAYIDPSTTTFLVQAGIGLAVAIAAGFTIYFRKAKKRSTRRSAGKRLPRTRATTWRIFDLNVTDDL